MKVVATSDGLSLVFTQMEQGRIMKAAHPTPFTTRQIVERLAACHSANLDSDLQDMIDTLTEENPGK
jgi:hypothetical protein